MKINWRYTIATAFVEGVLLLLQLGTLYLMRFFFVELETPLLINLVISGIILFTWIMITWSLIELLARQMLEETNKRKNEL